MPAVLMPVPEAAVNKNNGAVFFKDDIRFAGQFFIVNAVSETFCKKLLTEQYFRLCIGAPDPAHIVTALCRGMSVHWLKYYFKIEAKQEPCTYNPPTCIRKAPTIPMCRQYCYILPAEFPAGLTAVSQTETNRFFEFFLFR